ncbi:MAG TPA: hypothetical protein VJ508_15420, partial [Saprospiraceae bacterium]|nr:hypothetical protein [Saprospiraceae bacterium]
ENTPFPEDAPLWCKYIHGAINVFFKESHFSLSHSLTLSLLIGGDLPIGAGVSSSSSLVSGLMLAFQALTQDTRSRIEIASLSSRVEREIIGLQGGIMDQYAILLSQKDHVMMLDCRERTYEFFPGSIPGTQWILLNTKVKHQLIDSDYNQRAAQCNQAVDLIRKRYEQVKSLRDVDLIMLSECRLSEVLEKRSRFVIEENDRVHAMKKALEQSDAELAGQLLQASHHGLQYQYEVSCNELDHLAGLANQTDGVYGGRMMGGGFGGCVICLVDEQQVDDFLALAKSSYQAEFGFEPEVIQFTLSDGAYVIGDPPSEANSPAIAKKMWRDTRDP